MAAFTLLAVLLSLSNGVHFSARDPFAAPHGTAPTSGCGTELCRPLEELTLVAIVSGTSTPVAMFEDRDGQGLLAHRGDELGVQGARVTAFERECLVLTRFVGEGARQAVTERVCLSHR
jgi:hypothetical protein